MKDWQRSKTLWVSYVGIIIALLADPAVVGLVPLEWMPKLMALQAILGIVLRLLTNTAIAGTPAADDRTEPHQH